MRRLLSFVVVLALTLAPKVWAAEAAPDAEAEPERIPVAFFGVGPARGSVQLQEQLLQALKASPALEVTGPKELDDLASYGLTPRQEILLSQSPEFHLPAYTFKIHAAYALLVIPNGPSYQLRVFRLPKAVERLNTKLTPTDAAGLARVVQQLVDLAHADQAATPAAEEEDSSEERERLVPQAHIQHISPTEATANMPLVLTATIECPQKFQAMVHFRHSSSPNWLETPMVAKGNGEYVTSLGPLREGEVDYYIWVSSDDDNLDKMGSVGSELQPIRVRLIPKSMRSDPDALVSHSVKTKHSVPGYVTLGAAVVAATVGTVFGIRAKNAATLTYLVQNPEGWQAAKTRTQNDSRVATACWGAAGVLGVAGTLLTAFQVQF